jgi:hypothetical protein
MDFGRVDYGGDDALTVTRVFNPCWRRKSKEYTCLVTFS